MELTYVKLHSETRATSTEKFSGLLQFCFHFDVPLKNLHIFRLWSEFNSFLTRFVTQIICNFFKWNWLESNYQQRYDKETDRWYVYEACIFSLFLVHSLRVGSSSCGPNSCSYGKTFSPFPIYGRFISLFKRAPPLVACILNQMAPVYTLTPYVPCISDPF
jgi:hypothetical protein